jgi:hypothetical protein
VITGDSGTGPLNPSGKPTTHGNNQRINKTTPHTTARHSHRLHLVHFTRLSMVALQPRKE